MRSTLFCMTLICLSALPASSQNTPLRSAPVTLYTDFQQSVPPAVADALRAEVNTIMGSAGPAFEWRSLADFRGGTPSVALVVAHFEGRCDTEGLVMRHNQAGSLGWTEVRDGAIVPFVHVDCGRVRGLLQIDLLGCRSRQRDSLFGRALGRVMAHELYHVLALTAAHTTQGVAKKDFSAADLLAGHFQLDEGDTLRTSKSMQGLRASRQP